MPKRDTAGATKMFERMKSSGNYSMMGLVLGEFLNFSEDQIKREAPKRIAARLASEAAQKALARLDKSRALEHERTAAATRIQALIRGHQSRQSREAGLRTIEEAHRAEAEAAAQREVAEAEAARATAAAIQAREEEEKANEEKEAHAAAQKAAADMESQLRSEEQAAAELLARADEARKVKDQETLTLISDYLAQLVRKNGVRFNASTLKGTIRAAFQESVPAPALKRALLRVHIDIIDDVNACNSIKDCKALADYVKRIHATLHGVLEGMSFRQFWNKVQTKLGVIFGGGGSSPILHFGNPKYWPYSRMAHLANIVGSCKQIVVNGRTLSVPSNPRKTVQLLQHQAQVSAKEMDVTFDFSKLQLEITAVSA